MKNSSRTRRKVALNALLILVTIGVVVYLGAQNGGLESAVLAMRTADLRYLAASLGCWMIYAFIEGFFIKVFLNMQKTHLSLGGALMVGLVGVFYSAVTPAATGGQPMQVFAMKKRGVPMGLASSALAVKLFCWQTMLVLCGGALWLLFPEGPAVAIGNTKWFVIIGFIVNGGMMLLVLLLAVNPTIVRALIVICLNVGKFLHIVKDLPNAASKADAALYDFNASVRMIRKHPMELVYLLLLTGVEIIGFMSAAYCVLRALAIPAQYGEATTLNALLNIGASFTPLPGASGAQEGGFYLFFRHIVPEDMHFAVMIIWRFMTYYTSILIGMIFVVGESALTIRRARRDGDQDTRADLKTTPPQAEDRPLQTTQEHEAHKEESTQ